MKTKLVGYADVEALIGPIPLNCLQPLKSKSGGMTLYLIKNMLLTIINKI